jgi:hypothetical protein
MRTFFLPATEVPLPVPADMLLGRDVDWSVSRRINLTMLNRNPIHQENIRLRAVLNQPPLSDDDGCCVPMKCAEAGSS